MVGLDLEGLFQLDDSMVRRGKQGMSLTGMCPPWKRAEHHYTDQHRRLQPAPLCPTGVEKAQQRKKGTLKRGSAVCLRSS